MIREYLWQLTVAATLVVYGVLYDDNLALGLSLIICAATIKEYYNGKDDN